ncbi:hypothetical protein RB195_013446 [Necator americanus]|uniref:Homeobox protein SIX1 N-terminal SD domain-containing protein n=1 Tax=Necator americanus TaxID=51031 RepID=A0ABR1DVI7_NECAM
MAGSSFSSQQLDVICTALYQAKDGEQLVRLFRDMDSRVFCSEWTSQPVKIAYIYALYHSANFERLFEVIGRSRFDERYYKELQEIWYKARYKENESKRGKELGAVEKYRLRRKYPPPRSIWDGLHEEIGPSGGRSSCNALNIAGNPVAHGSGPTVVIKAHHVSGPPYFNFLNKRGSVSNLRSLT